MNTVCKIILAALGAALVALTGCGGGGSSDSGLAGIGGTGKIASGTITAFGSVFVNGVEYNTDGATFDVNDSSGTESDLRVGMVVTVTGTVSDSTGNANSIVYDSEVEGPVSGLAPLTAGATARSFTVQGIDVLVDSTATIFDNSSPGFSFDTLANDDIVEVSGFFDASGIVRASYIDKTGDFDPGNTEVEMKGTVVGATGANGTASFGESFTLNGITINIGDTSSTDLSEVPGATVTNGMFVEVDGLWVDATTVDAARIELEDDSVGDDGDEVSLEGLVSGFSGDLTLFFVNGQPVSATTASFEPANLQLANDVRVEVEGEINSSGVLIAESVESRGGDVEVQAVVTSLAVPNPSLNEGSITLLLVNNTQQLTVQSNSRTQYEDKTQVTERLRLTDISPGDYLEIRGLVDDTGAVVASEVRRDGVNGDDLSDEDVVLQGPVGSSSLLESSITILGVTFATDGSTEFEDLFERSVDSSTFYGFLSPGTLVEIEDENVPGNGIADEASLED
jgi:hypothetical protein